MDVKGTKTDIILTVSNSNSGLQNNLASYCVALQQNNFLISRILLI